MGIMSEASYPAVKDLPAYAGFLSSQVVTIPELLKDNGYHTYMVGKWHLGVQAPKTYIDKYKGKFSMGGDSLCMIHLNHLKQIGLIADSINSFFPNPSIPKWASLYKHHKEELEKDMEVYAAMVEYLDMSIGRLLDKLKQDSMYDNSMILFMSDNGANGAMATLYPGNADGKYLGTFNNAVE